MMIIICSFVGENVWLLQCQLAVRMHIHTPTPFYLAPVCLLCLQLSYFVFAHILLRGSKGRKLKNLIKETLFPWTFLWDHHWNMLARLSGSTTIIPLEEHRKSMQFSRRTIFECLLPPLQYRTNLYISVCQTLYFHYPKSYQEIGYSLVPCTEERETSNASQRLPSCMQMALNGLMSYG